MRLKGCHEAHAAIAARPCFNSKLVRLKERQARAKGGQDDQFQFQTGAIKSGMIEDVEYNQEESFNSKRVRLKVRDGYWLDAELDVSIPNWCD